MKRNWDLIRRILLKLEEKADTDSFLHSDQVKGYAAEVVAYHYKLMADAELINIDDISDMGGEDYAALSLTWQGHEFLDNIRNDTVWNKVKATIKSKGVDLSFELIKTVAVATVKSLFN